MAFNINNFISEMQRDGLRPNLFEIFFDQVGTGLKMPIRAKASAIPASSIGVAPAFYFGRQAKFAGNRVFGDWTVSVLLDEDDLTYDGPRAFLERWSDQLNRHVQNLRTTNYVSPAVYQMDGKVIQYGKDGSIKAQYQMIKCFPIDIGAIPLDWGANDQIAEFSVTFALNWWQHVETTDSI
jgi:hypothetical protein